MYFLSLSVPKIIKVFIILLYFDLASSSNTSRRSDSNTCIVFEPCNENKTNPPRNYSKIVNVFTANRVQPVELDDYFRFCNDSRCKEAYENQDPKYYLSEDASLSTNEYETKKVYEPGKFYVFEECSEPNKLTIRICTIEKSSLLQNIMGIGMFVSVLCLVLTFLLHAAYAELRNLHGKCLMCYIMSLAIGFLTMAYVKFYSQEGIICKIVGYVIYGSFMSSFLWLSVIGYDVWWTFQKTRARTMKSGKFWAFSVYAWGMSIILMLLCLIMDQFETNFRPKIGESTCFLEAHLFLYLYLPLIIIVSINCVFFLATLKRIYEGNSEMKHISRSTECFRHLHKSALISHFRLFSALFIVMGITWALEAANWLMNMDETNIVNILIDMWNTLAGVTIFIHCVSRSKVRSLIRKTFKNGVYVVNK